MADKKMTWAQFLSAPRDFLHGLLGGLLGPVLALAGAVGLIYALTGQLPAVKEVVKVDGSQHKAIALAPPLEARATWARYSGELRGALLELRARARSRLAD
ncbi:MAG: hypothetical protein ISS56_14440 [Anaerolineae bacterium]|jgi:hypothetical protein|nr:hypothetical protein [Anaerolineae bacterium]